MQKTLIILKASFSSILRWILAVVLAILLPVVSLAIRLQNSFELAVDRFQSVVLKAMGRAMFFNPDDRGLPADFFASRYDRTVVMPTAAEGDTPERQVYRIYINQVRLAGARRIGLIAMLVTVPALLLGALVFPAAAGFAKLF